MILRLACERFARCVIPLPLFELLHYQISDVSVVSLPRMGIAGVTHRVNKSESFMAGNAPEPQEFIRVVKPLLCNGDADALACAVQKRWAAADLCGLLCSDDVDVRRVTAVTLGLIGDAASQGCLAKALHDEDEQVNKMAEHGLWSIWFRSGSDQAMPLFQQGVAKLEAEEFDQAIDALEKAVETDPTFAEAYNQLAIANYFHTRWQAALKRCRETIDRVPIHFGAIAGMGHTYAQIGELACALRCYRHALHVNPRMPAIRGAVKRLTQVVPDLPDDDDNLPSFDRPLM